MSGVWEFSMFLQWDGCLQVSQSSIASSLGSDTHLWLQGAALAEDSAALVWAQLMNTGRKEIPLLTLFILPVHGAICLLNLRRDDVS